MRGSIILIILSALIILTFTSSVSETQAKTSEIKQWIIVNALHVDKNNVKVRLFYLDSSPADVKSDSRKSCKDGVNIILPAYMLMKYPLRIDFDLLNAKYHLYEKLKDKVAASGSMVIEI